MKNQGHKNKGANNDKKKYNPFEIHINRTKLHVVGQRSKNDRGMPGVARAKANKIVSKSFRFYSHFFVKFTN